VWFVGFSSTIVAGCYIGYDQPRSLGRGASGGGMCGPVFAEFMRAAVQEYGGAPFAVPPGGVFYPIDRYSGQRLPAGSAGEHVVYELFREGEAPFEGLLAVIDGGWGMGSDLPMFGRGEGGDVDAASIQPGRRPPRGRRPRCAPPTATRSGAHRHRFRHAQRGRALLTAWRAASP
jgi:penicillin-binding protein 1A